MAMTSTYAFRCPPGARSRRARASSPSRSTGSPRRSFSVPLEEPVEVPIEPEEPAVPDGDDVVGRVGAQEAEVENRHAGLGDRHEPVVDVRHACGEVRRHAPMLALVHAAPVAYRCGRGERDDRGAVAQGEARGLEHGRRRTRARVLERRVRLPRLLRAGAHGQDVHRARGGARGHPAVLRPLPRRRVRRPSGDWSREIAAPPNGRSARPATTASRSKFAAATCSNSTAI